MSKDIDQALDRVHWAALTRIRTMQEAVTHIRERNALSQNVAATLELYPGQAERNTKCPDGFIDPRAVDTLNMEIRQLPMLLKDTGDELDALQHRFNALHEAASAFVEYAISQVPYDLLRPSMLALENALLQTDAHYQRPDMNPPQQQKQSEELTMINKSKPVAVDDFCLGYNEGVAASYITLEEVIRELSDNLLCNIEEPVTRSPGDNAAIAYALGWLTHAAKNIHCLSKSVEMEANISKAEESLQSVSDWNKCPTCRGYGTVDINAEITDLCPTCIGTGNTNLCIPLRRSKSAGLGDQTVEQAYE